MLQLTPIVIQLTPIAFQLTPTVFQLIPIAFQLRGQRPLGKGFFPIFGILGFFPQDGSTAFEEYTQQKSDKNINI